MIQGNKTMPQPLLSIMIPTKNRYETLLPVLEVFIKNIQGDNYEIVVQDNSDNNQPFIDWFQKFHDEKIKYFYESAKLDIIQNTTKALEHCNGEYLIFIGDDDFVSPYIVNITEFIKRENIECLIYPPGRYWWDSVIFTKERGYLKKKIYWEPLNINTELIKVDSSKEMDCVLNRGGVHYYKLPRFYHGLVRRKVLDEIKEKTGIYLPGICPDMGFAMSLALVINEYHFMNYPVSVFGASRNSGAGWGSNNTHYGKIEEVFFLPADTIERWDPLLPEIWSAYTTNAQTIYDVFKTFHIDRAIDYEVFYASMLANEPMLKQYIKPVIKQYCQYNILKYIKICFKIPKIFLKAKIKPCVFNILYRTGNFIAGGSRLKIIKDKTIENIMTTLLEHGFK
jgi:hypothetical protein